jgi:hypothetical protein
MLNEAETFIGSAACTLALTPSMAAKAAAAMKNRRLFMAELLFLQSSFQMFAWHELP